MLLHRIASLWLCLLFAKAVFCQDVTELTLDSVTVDKVNGDNVSGNSYSKNGDTVTWTTANGVFAFDIRRQSPNRFVTGTFSARPSGGRLNGVLGGSFLAFPTGLRMFLPASYDGSFTPYYKFDDAVGNCTGNFGGLFNATGELASSCQIFALIAATRNGVGYAVLPVTLQFLCSCGDPPVLVSLSFFFRYNAVAKDDVSLFPEFISPIPGETLSQGRPAFFAFATYQLQTIKTNGIVFLNVRQKGASQKYTDGTILATRRYPVSPGDGTLGNKGQKPFYLTKNDWVLDLSDSAAVVVQAELVDASDSTKVLAKSTEILYRVAKPTLTFLNMRSDADYFAASSIFNMPSGNFPTALASIIEHADASDPNARAEYAVVLELTRTATNAQNHQVAKTPIREARIGEPVEVNIGSLTIPAGYNVGKFRALAVLPNGTPLLSDPWQVDITNVAIKDSFLADLKKNPRILVAGTEEDYKVPITWNMVKPGYSLARCISSGCNYIPNVPRTSEDFATFSTKPDPASRKYCFHFAIIGQDILGLGELARSQEVCDTVEVKGVLAQGITDLFKLGSTKLKNARVAATTEIKTKVVSIAVNDSGVSPRSAAGTGGRNAATNPGEFTPVRSSWTFDPAIPSGSLTATLELTYDPADLPSDADFDASKLEIVSLDPATGFMERLVSTVDTNAQTVSAPINGLAPVYGLAVFGAAARKTTAAPALAAGGASVTLAAVNPSASGVQSTLDVYTAVPQQLPIAIPAGQQISGALQQLLPSATDGADWLSGRLPSEVIGAHLLQRGHGFDALALQSAPSSYSVFPVVVESDEVSMEFHIVNPNTQPSIGTIYLLTPTGDEAGSATMTLAAKAKWTTSVSGIVSGPFQGYAVVSSDNDWNVAAVMTGPGGIAGSNARNVVRQPSTSPGRLILPTLGPDFATLGLVNTNNKSVNFTARAFTDSGVAVSQPVTVTLGPNEQYFAALPDMFPATNALPSGIVVIDTTAGGIMGEAIVSDPVRRKLNVITAGDGPPLSSIIPYMRNDSNWKTSLTVATGGAPASVTVAVYLPNGTLAGSARVALAANGRSSQLLSQLIPQTALLPDGFIRVDADQPVVAYAEVTNPASPDTGIVAAQPSSAGPAVNPPPASAPVLQVSPSSLDFGSVTVNQTKDLTLTLTNTGNARATVTAINRSNTLFSIVNLTVNSTAPLTVDPGTPRTITVRFSPTAAGAQSGTLTLVTDPAGLVSPINVTGSGAAAPPASGGLEVRMGTPAVAVTSLDFGTVAAGQTKDITVLFVNNGSVGGTFTSSFSNSKFTQAGSQSVQAGPFGGSNFITLRFSPADTSAQTGTWTISGLGLTTTIALTGNSSGGPPPASGGLEVRAGNPLAVITSLDFGTVAAGQTKDLVVRVINNGPVGGTITSTFSNAKFSQAGTTSVQAGPFGGYNDVTIRFSPTDTSAQTGTWTLSGVGLTTTIALTGNSGGTTGGGGGSACVAPATNLVSWWSGDGNANDLTGGNNGTGLGGLTYTTGKVGQAFQMNGSTSYVSIGNPTNLRPTSALTMNAWINPSVGPTGSNLMAIITKWGQTVGTTADADSFGMWLQQNGGSLSVYAAVHLSGGTNEPRALGGNVPLNTWSHVAMTFDGNNVIAYVNGQLVNTFPAAGSIISSSRNLLIGREDSFLPRAFNGAIDEVQILNRALTAAEIQAIYNAGANGVCKTGGGGSACVVPAANLTSWWPGDGNANDLTGGNNGTALGGLSYTTGKVGQAFQLNGSTSYVSIGNPTNLRPTNALTMNAWINPSVGPTGSNLMAIITKWGQTVGTTADADSFGMWLQQNGASLSVYAAVHLSGGTNEPRALGGNVPLNTWTHVAMTFDGSNVIAYVNGQVVNTFPAAGSIISSSRNVLIGREDSSLPRAFNGAIDEVQILNRALTAAEIQAIYNAGANGVCKTGG